MKMLNWMRCEDKCAWLLYCSKKLKPHSEGESAKESLIVTVELLALDKAELFQNVSLPEIIKMLEKRDVKTVIGSVCMFSLQGGPRPSHSWTSSFSQHLSSLHSNAKSFEVKVWQCRKFNWSNTAFPFSATTKAYYDIWICWWIWKFLHTFCKRFQDMKTKQK